MAKSKSVDWLLGNIGISNLVDKLGADMSDKIARRVRSGYDIDENSRTDWREKTESGLKVAKQETDPKSFPWNNASNVKFPLIASASIQFAARAYPTVVNGTDIVKAQVIGEDPDGTKEARAKRISTHMSWQCLDQMTEWESDHDQLLHGLPVFGTYFKKTLFDTLFARNRSICCTPFEVVVNMKHKGDLTTCRRITHIIPLYKNEVIERENAGMFVAGTASWMRDLGEEVQEQENFLEQHCWYDADGDGYEEPYIVTIHYDSGKVCRIVANYEESGISFNDKDKIQKIDKIEYFTKYIFIPSPDGDFYGVGFSQLLGPINESISTLINQLIDSGTLANMQSGFIAKGLRWGGGRLTFDLGEWKPVDTVGMSLKDSIVPLPTKDPSPVLFQLLGLLQTTGDKLASVSDAMSGELPSQNTPATTVLAVIEQGLKVFTAIYKRVFRSMKQEYKKLYRLNSLYMNEVEYVRVLDTQNAVFRRDYGMEDIDVVPVADPTMASEAQHLARANALMQTFQNNPDPMGRVEILRQYYEGIGAKNIDKLLNIEKLAAQANAPQPPPPEMMRFQLDAQMAADKHDIALKDQEIRENEAIARIQNIEADTNLKVAQTVKSIADAEAVEPGQQLLQYKAYLDRMKAEQQHERELKKLGLEQEMDAEAAEGDKKDGTGTGADTPPADGGVAGAPDNEGSAPMLDPGAGPPTGEVALGGNIEPPVGGADSPTDFALAGANLRNQFAAENKPGGLLQ